MNKETLKAGGVDYDVALARFCGDTELYESFLETFDEEESYHSLNTAMNSGDYAGAEFNAHALKGVAGNLGFTELFKVTTELLAALRRNDIESAKVYFDGVIKEFAAARKVIEKSKQL